jgi:hypothetical protein
MLPALADVVQLSVPPAAADEMLVHRGKLRGNPMREHVAAISFGATVSGKLHTTDLTRRLRR